jgi:hypothetical protein
MPADVPVNTGGGAAPMPAPESAPPPPASAPRPMSESDAVASVAGLLDAEEHPRRREPRRETRPAPAQPEVTREAAEPGRDVPESEGQDLPEGAEPEEAIGEAEEAASDEPDDESDHRIEPPNSWSEKDKAHWEHVPPEVQAVIARRETEQTRAFTQKTQEIAEHRKALEATFGEIQNERQSYATNLEQLLAVAMPEAQQFANVDWQRLAQESPADYVRLTAERDALRGRVGAIQGELQRVQAVAQQDYARNFAQLRASEAQRLAEKMPEFADREKGGKFIGEMRQWLQEQGFSAQEIGQVIDHRVILVAAKAMQADRALKARRVAETRRSDPAPSVQRPGVSQPRESNAARRRNQAMERLKQTGSEKDAIGYLQQLLG